MESRYQICLLFRFSVDILCMWMFDLVLFRILGYRKQTVWASPQSRSLFNKMKLNLCKSGFSSAYKIYGNCCSLFCKYAGKKQNCILLKRLNLHGRCNYLPVFVFFFFFYSVSICVCASQNICYLMKMHFSLSISSEI